MRGTRRGASVRVRAHGNTPADAGNSLHGELFRLFLEKHPRRCGELSIPSVDFTDCSETPPQMRGTLAHRRNHRQHARNTPADAGNSSASSGASRAQRKHPRRCGELDSPMNSQFHGSETPPQMRGTPAQNGYEPAETGNTPADAGNSARNRNSTFVVRKHPRRYGELVGGSAENVTAAETPPQMRGTHDGGDLPRKVVGNTPADAGNSRHRLHFVRWCKKHPRRCGELRAFFQVRERYPETPPQMRGTHGGCRAVDRDRGNTPADAGNSILRTFVISHSRKHPRRCGEL